MKDLRICIINFWHGFNYYDNIFIWLLKHKYNIIYDDINPDLVINGVNEYCKYKNSSIVYFCGEPTYPDLDNFKADYGLSCFYIDNNKHFRFPIYLYYLYDFLKNGDIDDFDYYFKKRDYNKDILKTKNKFCCFIQGGRKEGYDQFRDDFYKKFISYNYKKIDCPGTRYNNMAPIGGGSNHEGLISSRIKREFIKPYKFIISFENASVVNGYDGVMDVKVFDALTSNVLPIYWGNRKVNDELNNKCFINWYDYNDDDKVIQKVIEIDNNDDLYIQYMMEPPTYKNDFLNIDYLISIFDKILNK